MESLNKWIRQLGFVGLFGVVVSVFIAGILSGPSLKSFGSSLLASIANPSETAPPLVPDMASLAALYRKGCPRHKYTSVKQLSRVPNIWYIEGFLTEGEINALLNIAEPLFEESTVVNQDHEPYKLDKSYRSSWSAFLRGPSEPDTRDDDAIIKCVEERAAEFQGFIPINRMETLQVVRYTDSQEYREHYDWFSLEDPEIKKPGNRDTTFFVYLRANCTGGGTAFPKVSRPTAPEWCGVLKCQDENGQELETVEVNAKDGAAVFWYDLDETGALEYLTLHAGKPVIKGIKTGLNIWTRQKQFRH